jgi:hypothetical protein
MLLLSGCANKEMVNSAEKSGFLGSYSDLKEDKKYEGSMSWKAPDADFKKYNSVMIAPVLIQHNIAPADVTADQTALYQQMSQYLTQGAKEAVANSSNYKLVDAPSPTTMKLELALSAVAVTSDDLKAYQFVPVALVLTGVKRAIDSGAAVRALGQAKLVDSESGKPLYRIMSLKKGSDIKTSGVKVTFADVKPALDAWIKGFNDHLAALPHN